MGRGRAKGVKKLTVTEESRSGEEKIPTQKRRGRPQKALKDESDVKELAKVGVDDNDNKDSSIMTTVENGRKRRRNSPTKEKQNPVKEENSVEETLVADVSSTKPNGFRHTGSRRKNKPRRAAEVGVECFCNC